MYLDALAGEYRDVCELVALCDLSPTRMAFHNQRIGEQHKHPPVPTYDAKDFDRMVAERKPDVVIVTSADFTHHQYIIRAMELGCDAITEKPMTIDDEKARAIFAAIERTKRKLRVAFNYRYQPAVTKVRELMMQDVIGKPLAVDFSWLLDTSHGADYFRRWHSEKDKSGGLLVHKATHHFDLVNWWIASRPKRVFAMGDLKFYGRKNAEARGEKYPYDRYTDRPESAEDPFAFSLKSSDFYKGIYLNAEKDSGYVRDRNVFGDHITIEDTMAVLATYRNGVILNYSLIAYSPWEGFRVAISGTKGRIEFNESRPPHQFDLKAGKQANPQAAIEAQYKITVFPMFGQPYDVPIPKVEGGHGGGDTVLCADLFSPNPPPDPFHRAASHIDGAASILMGIAANKSIATGSPVEVDDLLKLP
jgi:predicted dehydrogenase